MKQKMLIVERTGKMLASNVRSADTWLQRLKGLLGSAELPVDNALWLRPCKGIHTIGMKYAIDVLFIDSKNRVKKVSTNLPPYRICRAVKGTHSVIELPAGSVQNTEIKRGDKILIQSRNS